MSATVENLVWENSRAEGAARLVLLALAFRADADGVCWPSMADIAKRARISVRHAHRCIQELRALGELEVETGRGRGHTNAYKVTCASPFNEGEKVTSEAQKVTSAQEKVTSDPLKGDICANPLKTVRARGTVMNSHTEQSRKSSPADSRPEDVFQHYRARIQPGAKLKAREEIKRRLKTFSAEELKRAVDNFAAAPWWMQNNGNRGAPWFFKTDARIEQFLHLNPEHEQRRNGHDSSTSRKPEPYSQRNHP